MLPTLPQLIELVTQHKGYNASYVRHPDFKHLYVRVADVAVRFDGDGTHYRCTKVIQIANIEAKRPGNGAFTRLVEQLIQDGYAVHVELAHELRFQQKLLALGFTQVNRGTGAHFLKGYEGHLMPFNSR